MQTGQGTDLSLCWPFSGLCVSIILAFIAGELRGGCNHDHRQQVDERSPFDPTAFSLALSTPQVLLTPPAHFLMSSLEPFSLALCPSLQASLPTPSFLTGLSCLFRYMGVGEFLFSELAIGQFVRHAHHSGAGVCLLHQLGEPTKAVPNLAPWRTCPAQTIDSPPSSRRRERLGLE